MPVWTDPEFLKESSLDTFIAYSFLDKLTKPYEDMKAFKLGVIDKDGKVLIPKDKRTAEQKTAFTAFDRLVFNLRKILTKYVPFGKTRLSTYATALFLLKEEKKHTIEDFVTVQKLIVEGIDKQFDNELLNEELADFLSNQIDKPLFVNKEYQLAESVLTVDNIVPAGDHIVFQDIEPVDNILGLNIYKGILVKNSMPLFVTKRELFS